MMQDESDKVDLFKSWTTEELGSEVFMQAPAQRTAHEMTRDNVEQRHSNLLALEEELHSRMDNIRSIDNAMIDYPSPMVSGELYKEFSKLRQLDAQAHSLRNIYGNEIQTRDLAEIEQFGQQGAVERIEAPLLARIQQLEEQHTALQETTADMIRTGEQAIGAMEEVQGALEAKGQAASTDWRLSSQQIANRLRNYNTRGFEQLTGEQQNELIRIQDRSPQVMSEQSTSASFQEKETKMAIEKAPAKSFGEEIVSEAPLMSRLISEATSNTAKAAAQVKELGSTTHTIKP